MKGIQEKLSLKLYFVTNSFFFFLLKKLLFFFSFIKFLIRKNTFLKKLKKSDRICVNIYDFTIVEKNFSFLCFSIFICTQSIYKSLNIK